MPISVTNPPSLLNLIQPKEPGASYVRKFGTIPPQVGKFAANTGQVEKLHELMVPRDAAFQTLEFHDHYVIRPTISFTAEVNYLLNQIGEQGQGVADDFEYSSETNPHFLDEADIAALDKATA